MRLRPRLLPRLKSPLKKPKLVSDVWPDCFKAKQFGFLFGISVANGLQVLRYLLDFCTLCVLHPGHAGKEVS